MLNDADNLIIGSSAINGDTSGTDFSFHQKLAFRVKTIAACCLIRNHFRSSSCNSVELAALLLESKTQANRLR